jgi:nicotinamidase-related amidase
MTAGTTEAVHGLQRERMLPLEALAAVDPKVTAVLAWDFQRGLGGHATNIDQLRQVVPALIETARAAGALIVRSRHIAPPPALMTDTEVWRIMRKQRVESEVELEPYMQRDSEDTEFVEGFEPQSGDLVVEKSTPSLFFDTIADARLRAAGIRTLVMTGVATDIGIEFTARHALALGYFPIVVTDGVGAYSQAANDRSLENLRAVAMQIDSKSLREEWTRER